MAEVKHLEVEFLTEEAFAPFGALLAVKSRPPDLRASDAFQGWVTGFETDGRTQLMYFSSRYQGTRFALLERHLNVTQTVIPIGGSQVVALAPPTDPDPESIPSPDEVRAFLADGTTGYVMKKGAWHAAFRMPLYPPSADFILITDEETTDELVRLPQRDWKRTQMVNYEERFGIVFELVLGHHELQA